jgi:hypothetical protein
MDLVVAVVYLLGCLSLFDPRTPLPNMHGSRLQQPSHQPVLHVGLFLWQN